jgi:hypothetical protein
VPVYSEVVGVVLTFDLLIKQRLSKVGSPLTETGDPVNRVNSQAKAVGLVADGQLKRRIDVSFFFVPAHMNIVLAGPAVR